MTVRIVFDAKWQGNGVSSDVNDNACDERKEKEKQIIRIKITRIEKKYGNKAVFSLWS